MAANADVTVDTLKVPGASLYYEVRGSGPVLLLITGGPVDAGTMTGLANHLSDQYTVVTYDQRGHSRSPLEGPPEDAPASVHAEDAHELLASFGSEPAYVFGNSGGATIGLDLVARYPDQVKTFVAHEPPLMELLPDRDHWHEKLKEIDAAYQSGGAFAGMGVFGAAVTEGGPAYEPPSDPSPEEMEAMGRMAGNFDFFLTHELPLIMTYIPDIDALRAASTHIIVGGGEISGEQGARRSATELAAQLGLEVTVFPGGHGGDKADPVEFAEAVRAALRS